MTYSIGIVIKEIRTIKNISIETLAEKTNISTASLYSIESQRRTPNFETIKNISDALDYPVALLMMKSLSGDEIAEKYTSIIEALYTAEI